jgi:heat shock protein HtpX
VHDPDALASALLRLQQGVQANPLPVNSATQATAHMYIVNPFRAKGMANLFSTHPPVEERVRRLQAMATGMPL